MLSENVWNVVYTTLSTKLKKKYPKITVVNTSKSNSDPTFPNVYVKQISATSYGVDLEHKEDNGANITYQIEASSDKGILESRSIMNDSLDILFKMGFNVVSGPYEESSSVWRMAARVNRRVGVRDKL